jgi:hypothetical protein
LENNTAVLTTSQTCGGIGAGLSPNNTYGSGRINAKLAIDAGGGTVNSPPTVTITTPGSDGQQFNCQTPVAFVATANDTQDGNISGSIQWSGAGSPATGTGGSISKTFSCTAELGNRTITASVTDKGGLKASDSVVVNIVNPNGVPAAPSNLTATVSGGNVILTWIDNSSNESGFRVYRRQQIGKGKKWGSWTRLSTTAAGATSYSDLNVASGSYQYYVTAYNSSGESAPSNTVGVQK